MHDEYIDAAELEAVREIGWKFWDPIGVGPDEGEDWREMSHADEYDMYLLAAMIWTRQGYGVEQIARILVQNETESMCIPRSTRQEARALRTAQALRDYVEMRPDYVLTVISAYCFVRDRYPTREEVALDAAPEWKPGNPYASLEPGLSEWADANGFEWVNYWDWMPSLDFQPQGAERIQLWVEPPRADRTAVCLFQRGTGTEDRSWKLACETSTLRNALDQALTVVRSWGG